MEKLLEKQLSDEDDVFEAGDVDVKITNVKKGSSSSYAPTPLLVFSPIISGKYPVLLFFHGFLLKPIWYKSLLQHISSHRYIVVAPKFSSLISQSNEVKKAAKVTEWLSKGLSSVLPEKVQPDLLKLAISGHSRGGKIAFSLALENKSSTPTPLKFQALLGIDPVAGSSPSSRSSPKILQYIPQSFDQSTPVAVIGAGLSNQRAYYIFPPFAPNGVNHSEFFNESKPPCYYFLAKDYGHTDILDDKIAALASLVSKSGKGSKELLRKAVGGIVVAFLEAKLGGQMESLNDIVKTPSLAPITFIQSYLMQIERLLLLDPQLKCDIFKLKKRTRKKERTVVNRKIVHNLLKNNNNIM